MDTPADARRDHGEEIEGPATGHTQALLPSQPSSRKRKRTDNNELEPLNLQHFHTDTLPNFFIKMIHPKWNFYLMGDAPRFHFKTYPMAPPD